MYALLPKNGAFLQRSEERAWVFASWARKGNFLALCVSECLNASPLHKRYLVASYLPPKPGPIIDHVSGSTLGMHSGLWNYTIGQGARLPGMPTQMFVAQKDPTKNELRLVPGS